MNEIIFEVTDAPEGGFTARALGVSIYTEADTLPALREACVMPCGAISTKVRHRE